MPICIIEVSWSWSWSWLLITHIQDVTVICLSLFTDGLSTTTPTLLFNLFALANISNKSIQEKLFEEVQANLPLDKPATPEALVNLPYLKVIDQQLTVSLELHLQETCRSFTHLSYLIFSMYLSK